MKKQIPLGAVVGIAVLIVAIAGYMALIRPKNADAQELEDQVAALSVEVDLERERQARAVAESTPAEEITVRTADLVRLAKAMPDQNDVAGVLVELDAIATGAGVEFLSISPQEPLDSGGFIRQPIQLTFSGSYYDLNELLYELRNLVRVRDGNLLAQGRLFTLDQFDIHEGAEGFPTVEALLTLSAYRYGTLLEEDILGLPSELPGAVDTPAETSPTETFEDGDPDEPPALPDEDEGSESS